MFWSNLGAILKRDGNFRWFLGSRMLSQLAVVAFSFYTVYVVRYHGLSEVEVGVMTGVLLGVQTLRQPIDGLDRRSLEPAPGPGDRRQGGGLERYHGLVGAISRLVLPGFHPGRRRQRRLVDGHPGDDLEVRPGSRAAGVHRPVQHPDRPATILAPVLGGILADRLGYSAAFQASALGGLATVVVLHFFVRDPQPRSAALTQSLPGEQTAASVLAASERDEFTHL